MRNLIHRLLQFFVWLFPVRFSLLIALFMPALVLFSFLWVRRLLAGLFFMDNAWQLLHITWMSHLVSAMVLVTYRVCRINAPARFRDYQNTPYHEWERADGWAGRWRWYLLVGMPVPIGCALATLSDPPGEWWMIGNVVPWQFELVAHHVAIIAAGWGMATMFLVALTLLQQFIFPGAPGDPGILPFETKAWGQWVRRRRWKKTNTKRLVSRDSVKLVPGYTRFVASNRIEDGGKGIVRLTPGHGQLAICAVVLVICYLTSYYWVGKGSWVPSESDPLSALFFILLAVLVEHVCSRVALSSWIITGRRRCWPSPSYSPCFTWRIEPTILPLGAESFLGTTAYRIGLSQPEISCGAQRKTYARCRYCCRWRNSLHRMDGGSAGRFYTIVTTKTSLLRSA